MIRLFQNILQSMVLAKPLIWSPEADKDLENILEFLDRKWPLQIVQDFLNNLFNTLDWIRLNPHSFMGYENADNIRKYVLSEFHTLYFEVFETHIDLLRIFDNRQDQKSLGL